jgi:zinc/manganese transport system substrate-binding protein
MRRLGALMVVLILVLSACGDDSSADDAPPTTALEAPLVVVTTTILGDIVESVAGDGARVEVLMPLGANPHAYEPSAQQAARIREADLIVANGVSLEEGLLDVIDETASEGVPVLAVGDALDPQPFEGPPAHEHEGEEGHEPEGGLDAHVWMDPVRMQRAVDLIAERLADLGVEGAAAGGQAYRVELEELSSYIEGQIATIPAENRKLVTNHFAYGYYADRFGLEMLGTVIPAATTEAEMSPAQFAELVEIIEREEVPAIFGSTTEPVRLAEAIAAEVGFDVEVIQLYTGSLGEPGSGAETYIDMMRTSTDRIVEALVG